MSTVYNPIIWTVLPRYFLENDFWEIYHTVEEPEVHCYWVIWHKVHELFSKNVNGCLKLDKLEDLMVRHALIHLQLLYDRNVHVSYAVFIREFRAVMKAVLFNRLSTLEQEPNLSVRNMPWVGLFDAVKDVLDCDTPSSEDYEDWVHFCEEYLFDFVKDLHVDMEDLAQLFLYGCAKTDHHDQWNMEPPLDHYMKCISVNLERGHYRDTQWPGLFHSKLNGLLGVTLIQK